MAFHLTTDHEERSLDALFRPISACLKADRLNAIPDVGGLETELTGKLRLRLQQAIKTFPFRPAIARALMIDADVRLLMEKIVLFCVGGKESKFWVGPCVEHANFFFKVLVGGMITRYPDVDSCLYAGNDPDYDDFLSQICKEWLASCEASIRNRTALYDWFRFATLIHRANDGGRLVRNLQLQKEQNVAVFRTARYIDWSAKPFTMVLILGQSPTIDGQKLSPLSREKIRKAVFENAGYKLAPIYMGCGGTVRPRTTGINESHQMRKCAAEEFGVPEERFAIEATSEHTYSNFMHAAILGAAMGMPHGSRMITFPQKTQREFIKEGMIPRANEEVFPPFAWFGSIETGEIDGSIVFTLNAACKDIPLCTTLWKDRFL